MSSSLLMKVPKAELHIHIEGTLEPEMMLDLARRNGVRLRFDSVEAIRKAYQFGSLQSFLDLYYEGMKVLVSPGDFRELALAYFARVHAQGVVHAEIFFDPQAHAPRGLDFASVAVALKEACEEAKVRWGITSLLIPSFLRNLDEDSAHRTLDEALEAMALHPNLIAGFGLDSSELGNPPSKFARVFQRVRDAGLHVVAHAGEEGPADYIRQALDFLGAERIDHGVRCLEDPELVRRLVKEQIPLTICPVSNWKLGGCKTLEDHPLPRLLDAGLRVSINSDDPAYLGAYVGENYGFCQSRMGISESLLQVIAKQSLADSFRPG
jgi:adenosine deaminase